MNSTFVSGTLLYIALSLQLHHVQSPPTAGSGCDPPSLASSPNKEKIRI